jgi:hypothetical protein
MGEAVIPALFLLTATGLVTQPSTTPDSLFILLVTAGPDISAPVGSTLGIPKVTDITVYA